MSRFYYIFTKDQPPPRFESRRTSVARKGEAPLIRKGFEPMNPKKPCDARETLETWLIADSRRNRAEIQIRASRPWLCRRLRLSNKRDRRPRRVHEVKFLLLWHPEESLLFVRWFDHSKFAAPIFLFLFSSFLFLFWQMSRIILSVTRSDFSARVSASPRRNRTIHGLDCLIYI